ncbi:MAG: NYN domain-containing protein [Gammaproteobacteria bacterium]|nr:NYN domain-containing protein [Gammaproteobacteria bacterium]
MQKTFLYWDNLNIYTGAQDVAVAREGAAARRQVRIDFQNLLLLAQAGRPIYRTTASGKINRAFQNVLAQLHNVAAGEKLHPNMLLDRNNHLDAPGAAVLLSGNSDFLDDLMRLHAKKWRVELLSWEHSCNNEMQEWAQENGAFVALDDYYKSVTYLKETEHPRRILRPVVPLDLSRRPA